MCRQIYGFTLLELLTAMAMAAVIMAMAIPGMQSLVHSYQARTALQDLRAGIHLARQTAINKNVNVIICPRQGNTCGPRNTWHAGAIIFEDRDNSRTRTPDDIIVGFLNPIDSGQIYWRAFRSRSYLQFTGSGLTAWQNGNLLYCPNNGDPTLARQLILNVAGRTYPSRDSDGDGIHEDARGRQISCS
ncbi:MAG: GspH/FimT family pseudopilin [bacterium]